VGSGSGAWSLSRLQFLFQLLIDHDRSSVSVDVSAAARARVIGASGFSPGSSRSVSRLRSYLTQALAARLYANRLERGPRLFLRLKEPLLGLQWKAKKLPACTLAFTSGISRISLIAAIFGKSGDLLRN